MRERLYTVAEAAETLLVSRQTIYNRIEAGRFPNSFSVGEGEGTITLIPASDVDAERKEEADKLIDKLGRLGFQSVPA